MKLYLLYTAIAMTLVTTGAGLIAVHASSTTTNSSLDLPVKKLSPAAIANTPNESPVHISIENIGIDTQVQFGSYDQAYATWSIDDNSAYFTYLTDENKANNHITFIYGHNSSHIFKNLNQINSNSYAYIATSDGHNLKYKYELSEVVNPNDVEALNRVNDFDLILQTCTGFLNQKRLIAYFTLVGN